jgi:hypothetical protein
MIKSLLQKFKRKYILDELNKNPDFYFQTTLDFIDCNSLFGYNRFYNCKSMSCGNVSFKNITEVDAVRRFTS